MRGFLSFQAIEFEASLHFKLDNPLNQVKHVAWSSSSKKDNQLLMQNHNQGFSKIFGTNGSTCCVAWIMVHSLHFLHSSSFACSLSFSPPLPHSITFSPPMHLGMNASAANFHQTCEMSAKNKDCSCVFNEGKPFVLGTTCGAVAFAPRPFSRYVVSSELAAGLLLLEDSSPRETRSLNVPFCRLHFHQGLLCPE